MAALVSLATFTGTPFFYLQAFFYALFGGLLPALIWLWFWMHEEHEHHEPKNTIWLTFLAGMGSVFLVFPLQQVAQYLIGTGDNSLRTIFVWATLEELIKFGAAYVIALRVADIFDEPIDAFVYLMTAALGFSAMENTLFLLGPLLEGNTIATILTGNMRFMGANLLHVAASGVLSLFVAFAFYRSAWTKRLFTVAGLAAAVLLHAIFNFLIILITDAGQEKIFVAFSFVWLTIILLILALERVKAIKKF